LFIRLEKVSDRSTGAAAVREVLEEIVQKAGELVAATDLRLTLQNFSGNPNLKEHLPDAVGKVGRYYSIPSELVNAARDKTQKD
jgi:hypothetical protein